MAPIIPKNQENRSTNFEFLMTVDNLFHITPIEAIDFLHLQTS